MNKEFVQHMRSGKLVKDISNGKVFKLIEDMSEKKETVKVVPIDKWERYSLLEAWIRNWEENSIGFRDRFTGNIGDCKTEMLGCETKVKITDVTPHNVIRFITPDYKTKFTVTDLNTVFVNGSEARVAYLDECHFTFIDKISTNLYGVCFHICQFAEICKRNNIEVKSFAK